MIGTLICGRWNTHVVRRGGYGLVTESGNSRPSVQLHRSGQKAIHCGSVRQGGLAKKILRNCQVCDVRNGIVGKTAAVCVGDYCTSQASFVLISFLKRSATSTISPCLTSPTPAGVPVNRTSPSAISTILFKCVRMSVIVNSFCG